MSDPATSEPAPAVSPSFKRQLKLEDFAFRPGSVSSRGSLRRSPRLGTPQGSELSESGAVDSSATPRGRNKRKAAAGADGSISRAAPTLASATSSSTSSPSKRARNRAALAPASAYAHMSLLPDAVGPGLVLLFVGLNPGLETSRSGHAYAHPSNLFWKLLHRSGLTVPAADAMLLARPAAGGPRRINSVGPVEVTLRGGEVVQVPVSGAYPLPPAEDQTLPKRFALGLTNLVARPSRNGAELGGGEMDAGVGVLEAKVRRWRPEAVCVVGKSIWESIYRVRHGRKLRPAEFRYGWQDEAERLGAVGKGGEDGQGDDEEGRVADGVQDVRPWKGARVFVASSTSGLAATLSIAEKERIWAELGSWVEERRKEKRKLAG